MNCPEQTAYPPRLAADVEIARREEGECDRFVVGSAEVGRYLMVGALERQVLGLLDGTRTTTRIREELSKANGVAPTAEAVVKFLGKLNGVGILAAERAVGSAVAPISGTHVYLRWSLCNPDVFFGRILPGLRWIWKPWFFVMTVMLFAAAGILALTHWPEVARYGAQTLKEHYLGVVVAAWLVVLTHEFAHGMTSKAFGGRATEIGVLLIYYCLPALYCNVSGLHLIPRRSRRLWVIAAGVYWQLLVGTLSFLAWFVFAPETAFAQLAMIFVLGSLVDVIFNANPLIKLDGYYFLSQWLGVNNLMERARACWSALLPGQERVGGCEGRILLVFGFLSFLYNFAVPTAIVWYAAKYLMDWTGLTGLMASSVLACIYAFRPMRKIFGKDGIVMQLHNSRNWRRWAPAAVAIAVVAALFLPWTASVGSYGALVAIPGREAIIRAPEGASLTTLQVEAGQEVRRGAVMGRMENLSMEEQIAHARTETERVSMEISRLSGELGVQREAMTDSEWQLARRRRELPEMGEEREQILARLGGPVAFVPAVYPAVKGVAFPPYLAALESEIGRLRSRLTEAEGRRERTRKLTRDGLLARSEMESAEATASALAADLEGAKDRLRAALVEHERRHAGSATDLNVAVSRLNAGLAQASNLGKQLEAANRLRWSLEARLAILEKKRAQFVLFAPVKGTVFGDDLARRVGKYFEKGAEIFRVADTREMLVRLQVDERAMGDISVGNVVRVKTRAFPDRVFRGVATKIGGENEKERGGQDSYRVELTIQNPDGLLKPGMRVFARVDFGRYPIGWVVCHKLKQALNPEMWML